MSEETQAPQSGEQPSAITLALSGASRDKADAYLALQMQEIHERNPYERSHLRLRRFSGWARAALEFSIGLIALAVVGALGVMVWSAAHSQGLIVESFAVPPQLAEQGLTGEVVASKLLDRLTLMQNATRSARAARSFANNWGDDLKVEIPDTGVSIGEAYRFLRGWLGHDTRISGEIVRTASGIAVTARSGSAAGATFTGPEADLDSLLQRAAEHVYGSTQPYRYGVYRMYNGGPNAEAVATFRKLAESGPASERSWGYSGWSSASVDTLPVSARLSLLKKALALAPDNFVALNNVGNQEYSVGRLEASLADEKKTQAMVETMRADASSIDLAALRGASRARLARHFGDFQQSVTEMRAIAEAGASATFNGTWSTIALDSMDAHDMEAARQAARNAAERTRSAARNAAIAYNLAMRLAAAREDWQTARAEAAANWQISKTVPGLASTYPAAIAPTLALAQARLGDFAAAEATIAATPADCYPCLQMRAQVAALRGQHARADWWFARAVAEGPSIPMAHEDWGRSLLARGDAAAAIAQFTLANKKGPQFADALEGWGEALMAQNQSHLALAKFAAAEKFAPNWGRLHLKWGQALAYAGKPEDAKAHFTRAATLDLTPSEKAELARVSR